MISGPMTEDIGETLETVAMLTVIFGPLELSGGGFNGDVGEANDGDKIKNFFGSVTLTPLEYITMGAYYLSNIGDSDGLSDSVPATLIDKIAGIGGFVSLNSGELLPILVMVEGEWLGALNNFAASELEAGGSGGGDTPRAYNVEVAVQPPRTRHSGRQVRTEQRVL